MTRTVSIAIFVVIALLAVACMFQPVPTATPIPVVVLTPTPTIQPPEAVMAIWWALVGQFQVQDPNEVRLVSWERVDWPDGCLGIPMRDACTEVIVPGYRIVVEVGGQEYEYHSALPDAQPYRLLLAAGPDPGIEEPDLTWEGEEDGGCQSMLLAADGRAAIGPCDAPHRPLRHFAGRDFLDLWEHWLHRFVSFQAETPSGKVIFRGRGQEMPTPAWRRAIAAWARLVHQELIFGRSGASWAAALSWRRGVPEHPGYCQFLGVETYGMAYASVARCGGGDPRDLGRGWLETEEWEEFDSWFYGRSPLYLPDLDLFSFGSQEMSESEVDALRRWAEAVYVRLTTSENSAPTSY